LSHGARGSAPLSWGLAVATYNRLDLLERCVTLALAQTRAPVEVVIVDASAEFDAHRAALEALVSRQAPGLRFVYERARRPQQTVQRNQAVALATADVLFMIDDDSLLYPTAAERIMSVYERPGCEVVVSVMTELHPTPPDAAVVASEPAEPPSRFLPFASRMSRALKGNFEPTFVPRPHFPVPDLGPGVQPCHTLHGARITVRRQVALEEPFDEALLFNAHEDRDAAWRFRRLGLLALVEEPLTCHAEAVRVASAPRKGFAYRGAWLLNYAYLVRKWCAAQPGAAARQIRRFTRSMLLLDLLSAVRTREFARWDGVRYVRRELLPRLMAASPERLSEVMFALSLELRAKADAVVERGS
jgi:GT2 family glycosyltransferase